MKCIAVNGCEDEEQKFCQCGPVGPSTSTGFVNIVWMSEIHGCLSTYVLLDC